MMDAIIQIFSVGKGSFLPQCRSTPVTSKRYVFLFLHYKRQYLPSNFTASIHRTIKKKLFIDTVMNFVFMFTAINSFNDTECIEYICCGPGVPYLTLSMSERA